MPRRPLVAGRFLCPSPVFPGFLFARSANALRQIFFFELQAHRVVLRGREFAQPIGHAQYIKDRGIAGDGDTWIARLNPDEGRPADGSPLRCDRHGDAPAPPRILTRDPSIARTDGPPPRHAVGNHNGMAFAFDRIPGYGIDGPGKVLSGGKLATLSHLRYRYRTHISV
jgi:hypothetical protein